MSSFYYLISSLPTLKTDAQMPFSYDKFLEMCKSSVSDSVYRKLSELTLHSSDGPLLKEWGKFNNSFTDELNYQRKIRLGQAVEQNHENSPVQKDAEAILNASNPLEAENLMLSLQFAKLDSLVAMHYFDEYVLYGYAIKLKLLERQSAFDKKSGSEEFKRLFDYIQAQILEI